MFEVTIKLFSDFLYSYGDLQNYARQKKHKTYILKPDTGCQGKGIWCTRNPKEIRPTDHMVCQQYLSKVRKEGRGEEEKRERREKERVKSGEKERREGENQIGKEREGGKEEEREGELGRLEKERMTREQ